MREPTIKQVWEWLDSVPDPEIPVISVVDLGIVRDIVWEHDTLKVTVTPTYSGCPAISVINLDIERTLREHGIENLELKSQISPAWTTDWLTEKGKKKLKEFGIAPPDRRGKPENCPLCGSKTLEKVSQFGSTPCKAHWRCLDCLESFDYFKCI